MGSAQRLYRALAPMGLYRLESGGKIDAELAAYIAAFSLVEELLEAVREQAFIQTATGFALLQHEKLVGIQENPGSELAARREMVIYRVGVAPFDFTAERMSGSICAAGLQAEVVEHGSEERLQIIPARMIDSTMDLERIFKNLNTLLPVHLDWELDQGVVDWDETDVADIAWERAEEWDLSWDLFEISAQQHFLAAR
jgi:Uncharacterized protein conserved in bacteria (DUF2313).